MLEKYASSTSSLESRTIVIFDFLCFFAYLSCSVGPIEFKLGQDVKKLPLIIAIGINALKVKMFCCLYVMLVIATFAHTSKCV